MYALALVCSAILETNADIVLLYGGLAKNMLPVAKAIKQSNAKLILKMDSAFGIIGFFDNTIINIKRSYWFSKQGKSCFQSILIALVKQFSMLIKRRNEFLTEYLLEFKEKVKKSYQKALLS